jgi:alpha-L-fucosidase
MFSDAGPDVRWIGNERGSAGETNWSTMDPAAVPYPGADGPGIIKALQEGDPNGTVWRPGETDVSIRPGWFYHFAEDARVKTVEELVGLYFTSVGRNSKLLLNVPPSRAGVLHDTDTARLRELGVRRDILFRNDLTEGRRITWRQTGARTAETGIELGRLVTVGIADLGEDIAHGQLITRYALEGSDGGAWRPLATGTTIGYRKLDRLEPVRVLRVRLRLDALERPRPVRLALFSGE